MTRSLATALVSGLFVIPAIGAMASGAHGPGQVSSELPGPLASAFRCPAEFRGDLGTFRSPLAFDDGRPVRDAAGWPRRRKEILASWHGLIGAWPPLIERPRVEVLSTERREGFDQRRVRVEVAAGRTMDGYLLVPDGRGPFPAVLVVFYEPETAIGRGKPGRDFALQLVRRRFVALSIGISPYEITPGRGYPRIQPLSYLAYVAANCYNALAHLPEVDRRRIGVMGHSYGGKWALFASCLDDRFACGVWSDPGVVFDESRPNVNYWEPWYLGWDPGRTRARGLITPERPRTGAYKALVESGHDLHELHALMAPRPFLISGGSEDTPERWRALNHAVAVNRLLGYQDRVAMSNRPGQDPTEASNEK
ncbi:MAG: prolyl oligopeptidase family serine peptidase, partial [Isosphaeraceae bacterium]